MLNQSKARSAVAVIRVSSIRQGIEGDSPEVQKEQIIQFAASRNIRIKQTFTFTESASKDLQPIQKAIDFCKNPRNKVDVMLVKAIDRFTRGGVGAYLQLKSQLELCGVELIDLHGIISTYKVNTMEHFGVSYKWSVFSPTKNAELLEAERGKDEIRDIFTRLIGSEIRYTREGYWMRRPPYGYTNEKVETRNGKRSVLRPYPPEAFFIEKMFELRCRGTLDDQQIVDRINRLGFKGRAYLVRSKHDRTRIIAERGGGPLTVERLRTYIQHPIYAGILCEKWTFGQAVRGRFTALVPIETFNKANKGKVVIKELYGEVSIRKRKSRHQVLMQKRGLKTAEYPFRRVVMCPTCELPLYGSASRGKLNKYYPAYHCGKNGHYFRVPRPLFDRTLEEFVAKVSFSPEYLSKVVSATLREWERRRRSSLDEVQALKDKIAGLQAEVKIAASNLKFLRHPAALQYAERDLLALDDQIKGLQQALPKDAGTQISHAEIRQYVHYFSNNLRQLILERGDGITKAAGFALLFACAPTFNDLKELDGSTLASLFRLSPQAAVS